MVKIFKVLYNPITVVPQQKLLPDYWVEADTPTPHLPCSLHAHDFAMCAENNFKVQPMLI